MTIRDYSDKETLSGGGDDGDDDDDDNDDNNTYHIQDIILNSVETT